MTSPLIQILKPRVQSFVSQGVAAFETKNGRFKTDKERKGIQEVFDTITPLIIDRIERGEAISIEPFKTVLLESLFIVGIGRDYPVNLINEIVLSIETYTKTLPGIYVDFLRELNEYGRLISEALSDIGYFSQSSIFEILQTPEEYQYLEDQFHFSPIEIDNGRNRIFTLFRKSRYWEVFKTLSDTTSYSPLSYNRVAGDIGKTSYRIPITYSPLVIYEGTLYKLNSNIASPSRETFEPSQWTKHTSKRLSFQSTFKEAFKRNIQQYYAGFLDNSFDINAITSDSTIIEYGEKKNVNKDLLTTTFGGEGKALYDAIERLKVLSDYFGAYEGSIVGGIDYITRFSEYLLACSYGRNEGNQFELINNEETFGKFDVLFRSKITPNRIPGLNFLKGFIKLKSFAQGQSIDTQVNSDSKTITYNPVYSVYKDGVKDGFKPYVKRNTYSTAPSVDLLLSSLTTLYNKCLYIGDLAQAMSKASDSRGRLKGQEGLGSITPQIDELQRIFPPSQYMNELPYGIGPGLSGGIKFLLETYSSLSATFVYTQLPGKSLEFILDISSAIGEQIQSIVDTIKKLSIASFSFIPNLSTRAFESQNTSIINFLRSLGFKESEINQLLQVETFADLVTLFAPLSNSDDLKSFFKGYELSQLIYELGGDEGINAYLSFLYSSSDISNLLNILQIAQKDKSKVTYIQIDKYPKLIGLLIGLTYAIDPSQLIKFDRLLGQNNLTLLESISYLLQSGQSNIIKSKEDIELLRPIIQQSIRGTYLDGNLAPDLTYKQANSLSPIALKQWTKVISDNLGSVNSKAFIERLYDKSVGLTAKELLTILNPSSPNSSLTQLIDGFNGGNFTKFLQYANITGLGIKLGYYKNSYQLDNFELGKSSNSLGILTLVEAFEDIGEVIRVLNIIFESSLDYTYNSEEQDQLTALLNSQNKTYGTLVDTISNLLSNTDEESIQSIVDFAGNGEIIESPGIGNSRLPNRLAAVNSITPEQYRVLFASPGNIDSVLKVIPKSTGESLINNFFKLTEANKLINQISTTPENSSLDKPSTQQGSWNPISEYENPPQEFVTSPLAYKVPRIYMEEENLSYEMKSGVLGISYLSSEDLNIPIPNQLVRQFDPVLSCQRFGGSNCQELYQDVADRCVNRLNKSIFPEEYRFIPGQSPTSVAVDRPLGTFVDFKPSRSFVPTSSYNSPPPYSTLLGNNLEGFGNNGEPITSGLFPAGLVFSSGGGEVSEYNNTEFATLEGIKVKYEKDSEFGCATFASPYEYQICMNILKCKKFSLPFEGKSFLDFCPKTLSGGRLK